MSRHRVALLILGFVASACTFTVPLSPTAPKPKGVVPIPLTVGVYYSPEFRETVHVRVLVAITWVTPIGEGSVGLLDRVLPMAFERVVPIESPPPLEGSSPTVAAILVPRLEAFDLTWPPTEMPVGLWEASVSYRFSLYEADGTPIVSWVVRGSGKRYIGLLSRGDSWDPAEFHGAVFDLATENAAQKFLVGFRELPEVRRWLYRAGVRDAK